MFIIKQILEDFIVNEIPNLKLVKTGSYNIYKLKKINENTETAVQKIAEKLRIKRKNINYAGQKDKKAITTQYISIKGKKINSLKQKNISIEFVGHSNEPLSLGCLKGNAFEITIRNISKKTKIKPIKKFINLYGEQRFSQKNTDIGKNIIKRDFKSVISLIKEINKKDCKIISLHLKDYPNDYVNAIKITPKKILFLYVHSYQSLIWNKTAIFTIKNKIKTETLPLIGFSTEVKNKKLKNYIDSLLKKDKISLRDFIIREIPYLSIEGTSRKLYSNVKNIKIGKLKKDNKNKNKYKIKISFALEKGSYATEYLKQIIS